MNAVIEKQRATLRDKLHSSIDKMDTEKLQEISSFISERAFNNLSDLITKAWDDGTITEEKLQTAIKDYRSKQ
jgi:hypothetical protein